MQSSYDHDAGIALQKSVALDQGLHLLAGLSPPPSMYMYYSMLLPGLCLDLYLTSTVGPSAGYYSRLRKPRAPPAGNCHPSVHVVHDDQALRMVVGNAVDRDVFQPDSTVGLRSASSIKSWL